MNPLTRKTLWRDKLGPDSEGNVLIAERSQTSVLSPTQPGAAPTTTTCTIEIISPAEDDNGKPVKRRLRLNVDRSLVDDISGAMRDIERAELQFNPSQGHQHVSSKGASGIVVTLEVPPFADMKERIVNYVVGDGAAIRMIFESVDAVQTLYRTLKAAVD